MQRLGNEVSTNLYDQNLHVIQYSIHLPTILTVMVAFPLTPPLVAVQVWVPPSPEWRAARDITLVVPEDEVSNTQVGIVQVVVHTYW